MNREIKSDYITLIINMLMCIIVTSLFAIILDYLITLKKSTSFLYYSIMILIVFGPAVILGFFIHNRFKNETKKILFTIAFASGYILYGIISIFTSAYEGSSIKHLLIIKLLGDILFFWYPYFTILLYKNDEIKFFKRTFNRDNVPYIFLAYYFAISFLIVSVENIDPVYSNLEELLTLNSFYILFGLVSAITSTLINNKNKGVHYNN